MSLFLTLFKATCGFLPRPISPFDDKTWQVVSLPNGIEYLPTEASGCINYQGEVWYRKRLLFSKLL